MLQARNTQRNKMAAKTNSKYTKQWYRAIKRETLSPGEIGDIVTITQLQRCKLKDE